MLLFNHELLELNEFIKNIALTCWINLIILIFPIFGINHFNQKNHCLKISVVSLYRNMKAAIRCGIAAFCMKEMCVFDYLASTFTVFEEPSL